MLPGVAAQGDLLAPLEASVQVDNIANIQIIDKNQIKFFFKDLFRPKQKVQPRETGSLKLNSGYLNTKLQHHLKKQRKSRKINVKKMVVTK